MQKINFPEMVRAGMKRKGLPVTGYQLSKLVKNKITITTCNKFIAGGVSMRSDNLALVLQALGARLTYKKRGFDKESYRQRDIRPELRDADY